ncbi:MAG: PrsW family intramembrane metalloprotease [Myxococcales bacterium]|nr:PrsW family intramembrane metalloprotease [Myxococcales bacterium]
MHHLAALCLPGHPRGRGLRPRRAERRPVLQPPVGARDRSRQDGPGLSRRTDRPKVATTTAREYARCVQWLAILIPILPGIFWLWVFYQADRFEPEPPHLILATFGLGALAIFPAWLLERLAGWVYPPFLGDVDAAAAGGPAQVLPIFLGCFLIVGPAEELCKFLAVRLYIYRHKEFDEPLDGIIYAASAALGFASFENVLYVIDFNNGGTVQWETLLARSLMALPGHVIFSATWGYGLGRQKFRPGYPAWAPLFIAAALHGTYDFLLMVPEPKVRVLCLVFMAVMVPVLVKQIRTLRAESPFRPGGPRSAEVAPFPPRAAERPPGVAAGLLTLCGGCGVLSRWEDPVCAACGLPLDKAIIHCGRCRQDIPHADDPFCPCCGTPIWPV